MTKTFTIKGITDESYYMAILGYPPTIITSDRVVRSFADQCITLKTSIKYQKEYDRNTEKNFWHYYRKMRMRTISPGNQK